MRPGFVMVCFGCVAVSVDGKGVGRYCALGLESLPLDFSELFFFV